MSLEIPFHTQVFLSRAQINELQIDPITRVSSHPKLQGSYFHIQDPFFYGEIVDQETAKAEKYGVYRFNQEEGDKHSVPPLNTLCLMSVEKWRTLLLEVDSKGSVYLSSHPELADSLIVVDVASPRWPCSKPDYRYVVVRYLKADIRQWTEGGLDPFQLKAFQFIKVH